MIDPQIEEAKENSIRELVFLPVKNKKK